MPCICGKCIGGCRISHSETPMAAKKQSRCWPGYEPAPGKPKHSQGSCRPKAESKTTPREKQFRARRRRQLDKWEAQHPHTRKSAAQHLSAPGAKKKTATKKRASKRASATSAKGTTMRRSSTSGKSAGRATADARKRASRAQSGSRAAGSDQAAFRRRREKSRYTNAAGE